MKVPGLPAGATQSEKLVVAEIPLPHRPHRPCLLPAGFLAARAQATRPGILLPSAGKEEKEKKSSQPIRNGPRQLGRAAVARQGEGGRAAERDTCRVVG